MKSDSPIMKVFREPPEDIDYTNSVEGSVCAWCDWSKGGGDYFVQCSHPRKGASIGDNGWHLARKFNAKADCDGYRPSFFTQLVRRFGLRRPIALPVSESDS